MVEIEPLASIQNAVTAGMVLRIHDRRRSGRDHPSGGLGFTIVRLRPPGRRRPRQHRPWSRPARADRHEYDPDGGSSSSHGRRRVEPPRGRSADPVPSNPSQIVTSYPLGAGAVVYSTIPLDYYLDSGSLPGFDQTTPERDRTRPP
jgi:hypothetical protein